MAYEYSKGWFIQQLKAAGISYHPIEKKKLELYKTYILRRLYDDLQKNHKKNRNVVDVAVLFYRKLLIKGKKQEIRIPAIAIAAPATAPVNSLSWAA